MKDTFDYKQWGFEDETDYNFFCEYAMGSEGKYSEPGAYEKALAEYRKEHTK